AARERHHLAGSVTSAARLPVLWPGIALLVALDAAVATALDAAARAAAVARGGVAVVASLSGIGRAVAARRARARTRRQRGVDGLHRGGAHRARDRRRRGGVAVDDGVRAAGGRRHLAVDRDLPAARDRVAAGLSQR